MQSNLRFDNTGECFEVAIAFLDCRLMSTYRAVGRLKEEHRFACFLSHWHQRTIVFELRKSVLVHLLRGRIRWHIKDGFGICSRGTIEPTLKSLGRPTPAGRIPGNNISDRKHSSTR